MYKGNTVGAVILAAGESNRMGQGINKVYKEVMGKPVLAHSVDSFCRPGITDEIVLVYNEKEESLLKERVLEPLEDNFSSLSVKCVPGGERRQDSSRVGLEVSESEYVCIHDGARPNFGSDLIVNLLDAAIDYGAAFPGVKPVDTIRASDQGFAGSTIDRNRYVKVQTPQCFERNLLLEAMAEAIKRELYFTDDAGIVLEVGDTRPKIVEGKRGNLKITTPEDARLIEVLMSD